MKKDNIDYTQFNRENLLGQKRRFKPKDVTVPTEVDSDDVLMLQRCNDYYDSLQDFRDRRERARKYMRGDQWHELINNPDYDPRASSSSTNSQQTITEEDYIKAQGKIPFKQNIIRKLVRNLLGQYRTSPTKTVVHVSNRERQKAAEMLTMALQSVHNVNKCPILDTRNFEEFILSGAAISKTYYDFWSEYDKEDVKTENVNVNRVFFNSDLTDVRMDDLKLIGEIKDMPLDEIVNTFANTRKDEQLIREWYNNKDYKTRIINLNGLSSDNVDNLDFYVPDDNDKCRLVEIWYKDSEWRLYVHDTLDASYKMYPMDEKEMIDQENEDRLFRAQLQGVPEENVPLMEYEEKREEVWKVKIMTPLGHCLYESETPYEHGSHPYSIILYPLLDGEVWGLVEDIIDQQRYINRLISLLDFIMGASAKGMLLVPESVIPDGMSIEDFSTEWSKFNGVVSYKPDKMGNIPKQISTNSTNAGITQLLSLQLKMIEDISGVHGAIQGKDAGSGTPASLYAQEAQNATMNTKDYFDSYAEFKRDRDRKMLKLITQYYDDKRYLSVSGNLYHDQANVYDPDMVRSVDFVTAITQSQDTPMYRQMIDNTLMQLLERNLIDVQTYLENSSLPFADSVLESIKRRQEQAQMTGNMMQLSSPDLAGRAGEAGDQAIQELDPNAQAVIQQLLAQQQND